MTRKRMSMRQDSIEALFSSMNRLSIDLESGKSDLSSNCEIFNTTGLFSDGFKKISDQFSKLSSIALEIGRTAREKSDSLFEKEMNLFHLAQEIEIPKDLCTVDTIEKSNYQNIYLGKEDGKKVNTTSLEQGITATEEIKLNRTNLSNIHNDYNSELINVKEPSGSLKSLGNINNGNNTNPVSMKEINGDVEILENINKGTNEVVVNMDSSGFDPIKKRNLYSFSSPSFENSTVQQNISLDDYEGKEEPFFDDFYG